MFGFGGWLNRFGWRRFNPSWYEDLGPEVDAHYDATGCPGYGGADWFDGYPDDYYWLL